MGRSRYSICDEQAPHFLTCTVINWMPLFTRPQNEQMLRQKLDYIHANPVKRGYVEEPTHWRYSSAKNYAGLTGLIPVYKEWF